MHFLPLLKTSLLLNDNNFQIPAVSAVLTSDSIVRYFVNVDFVTEGVFVE